MHQRVSVSPTLRHVHSTLTTVFRLLAAPPTFVDVVWVFLLPLVVLSTICFFFFLMVFLCIFAAMFVFCCFSVMWVVVSQFIFLVLSCIGDFRNPICVGASLLQSLIRTLMVFLPL